MAWAQKYRELEEELGTLGPSEGVHIMTYLSAMTHPARVRIYNLLKEKPRTLQSLWKLLNKFGYSKESVGYHLEQLSDSSITSFQNDEYSLIPEEERKIDRRHEIYVEKDRIVEQSELLTHARSFIESKSRELQEILESDKPVKVEFSRVYEYLVGNNVPEQVRKLTREIGPYLMGELIEEERRQRKL